MPHMGFVSDLGDLISAITGMGTLIGMIYFAIQFMKSKDEEQDDVLKNLQDDVKELKRRVNEPNRENAKAIADLQKDVEAFRGRLNKGAEHFDALDSSIVLIANSNRLILEVVKGMTTDETLKQEISEEQKNLFNMNKKGQ